MRDRKTQYRRKLEKPRSIEKKGLPTKKVAVVVGKAYTIDQLQDLIASLSSGSSDREIIAVTNFIENQSSIAETAVNTPEISGTEIVELVIAAVLKNEKELLSKFEKENNVPALTFIAKSSSMPPPVQKRAAEVLQRAEPQKIAKEEITFVLPYTPKEVQILIKNLESKVEEIKISAAIQFIHDYPRVTPAVLAMPLLTVTSVTTKAVEVIKVNTDRVLDAMVQKKMVPALIFLSSLSQVPLPIQKRAREAAEKLLVSPVEKPREYASSKHYAPMELQALLDGLGSVERVRAVRNAIEFLKNYDIIIQAISKAPMLTVTEVTSNAVKVIETNLGSILKELKRTNDTATIEFLAHSSKFSSKTRKKAAQVLKLMFEPSEE
ncbi:hypothetical protein KKB44_01240 [Candidatus Micrarchaeota archaeon]|nr:hypothetical protein [Candidatus Micrarchaeota archaeon]